MVGGYEERPSRVPGAVVWRSAAPGGAQRVLPDGCMDLLWHDGELLIAGPDTSAYEVTDHGAWAGLRFPPGVAPAVLGLPAHELRDRRVPLADLWPSRTVRPLAGLVNRTADAPAALESVALRLLPSAPEPDPACAAAVTALASGSTVLAATRHANLSERQLHRRFLTSIGYGPKTLARILRLQRALELARAGTPLAAVAARAGYADQPHFSREVKDLAGESLTRLLRVHDSAA